MGDISIIARKFDDGKHVQYGWSGNGGYYKMLGSKLLEWYTEPESVEYLFGLGQFSFLGAPGSENGGYGWLLTTVPTGEPHWVGTTEREIFSRIAFIDYGYLYDTDNKWYYVVPGPFRIKVPLEYIDKHLDDRSYEFDERKHIEREVIKYIFEDYYIIDEDFKAFMETEMDESASEIYEKLKAEEFPIHELYDHYNKVFSYFDDWVVIKTDKDNLEIIEIIMRKKAEDHIETCLWGSEEA